MLISGYKKKEAGTKGCRLERLELLNWGVFDGKIAVIEPNSNSMLLTGNIGTGKSTIVDAMSTLLISEKKIRYNKAASGGDKTGVDRTLKEYVFGTISNSDDKESIRSQSNSDTWCTILLATFKNTGGYFTTAMVLRPRDSDTGIIKNCYCIDANENIKSNFSSFSNFRELKKRLVEKGFKTFDKQEDYLTHLYKRLGVKNKRAIELFQQIISLKVIDNLDKFLKDNVLENVDNSSMFDEMGKSYEDIKTIEKIMRTAEEKQRLLRPVVDLKEKYEKTTSKVQSISDIVKTIEPWFILKKTELLKQNMDMLIFDLKKETDRTNILETKQSELQKERDSLVETIAKNGGDYIKQLVKDIAEYKEISKARLENNSRYTEFVKDLYREAFPIQENDNISSLQVLSFEDFCSSNDLLNNSILECDNKRQRETESAFKLKAEKEKLEKEKIEVNEELKSLQSSGSNIASEKIRLRETICKGTGIREDEIPFAGELVRVADPEWENAAERLFGSYAETLLVPKEYGFKVSSYINDNRMNSNTRWEIVDIHSSAGLREFTDGRTRIVDKLEFKKEHPFSNWLETKLRTRYQHVCGDGVDEIEGLRTAITKNGLVRNGSDNRKDDRIYRGSRSGMGWDNKEKIRLFQDKLFELDSQLTELDKNIAKTTSASQKLETLLNKAAVCLTTEFNEIDFESVDLKIKKSEEEKQNLENEDSSNILTALNLRKKQIDSAISSAGTELDTSKHCLWNIEDTIKRNKEETKNLLQRLSSFDYSTEVFVATESFIGEVLKTSDNFQQNNSSVQETVENRSDRDDISLQAIDSCKDLVKRELEKIRSKVQRELESLIELIQERMNEYLSRFRSDNLDLFARVSCMNDFEKVLSELETDDLPRHKEKLNKKLKEIVRNSIRNLHMNLEKQNKEILKKVEGINESLKAIDYNSGRYIRIESIGNSSGEIRDFRRSLLLACENFHLDFETEENDERTRVIKELMSRIHGRPGFEAADKEWLNRVSDVRNWREFKIEEINREDETVFETYSSSTGKSGGQKEKLANVLLAAGIMYTYDLNESNPLLNDAFRLIIIDEAFSRSSDESTEFCLNILEKLGLQFVLVTPFQKLDVIENHVSSFCVLQKDSNDRVSPCMLNEEEYQEMISTNDFQDNQDNEQEKEISEVEIEEDLITKASSF